MRGNFLEAKDIEIGMEVQLHDGVKKVSTYYDNLRKNNPKMHHLIIKSVHGGSKEVFFVNVIDEAGKNLGQAKGNGYICAGYNGNYDIVKYMSKPKYNLEDIFDNLDKLADKV